MTRFLSLSLVKNMPLGIQRQQQKLKQFHFNIHSFCISASAWRIPKIRTPCSLLSTSLNNGQDLLINDRCSSPVVTRLTQVVSLMSIYGPGFSVHIPRICRKLRFDHWPSWLNFGFRKHKSFLAYCFDIHGLLWRTAY